MTLWTLRALSLILVTASAFAQEAGTEDKSDPGKRVPATMLSPEQSGILLSQGREALEEPDRILETMSLQDGDLVADIGCGNGYYTLRLAKKVGPKGIVLAVDVQQGMLDQLDTRRRVAGIANIYPILGAFEDPGLPPGKVDWILLVDAYHEFSNPEAMLARMGESLAPGGRIALLEYRAEQDPATIPFPIPRAHKMTVDEVMGEWTPAGFELVARHEFLPAQHYFIFKRAGDDAPAGGRYSLTPAKLESGFEAQSFGDQIYFAGQPSEADLKEFASKGVKTVLNLRTQPEMDQLGFDEEKVVQGLGMSYVHRPIGREPLSDSAIEKIFEAVEAGSEGKMLIHCASSNRVGYVWSMYRNQRRRLSTADALEEGRAAGLSSPVLEERARAYLAQRSNS